MRSTSPETDALFRVLPRGLGAALAQMLAHAQEMEAVTGRARSAWFPSNVLPARTGVYERDFGTIGIRFAYWTGKFWGGFAMLHAHAVRNRGTPTAHPVARWRGLARKP